MNRRHVLAALGAAALPAAAGCAATDPPTAEPPEGFAELRLRLINDGDAPATVMAVVTSDDGEFEEELSLPRIPSGTTNESRAVAFPRSDYTVRVAGAQPPEFRWNADACGVAELTLRATNHDLEAEAACQTEWES